MIVILLVALVRVRSLLTAVVMLVALGATGALWWWRDDAVQAQVLVGAGIVLLVGAWRHLGAVLRTRDRSSDPGVLASLTHVPRVVWNALVRPRLRGSQPSWPPPGWPRLAVSACGERSAVSARRPSRRPAQRGSCRSPLLWARSPDHAGSP